MMRLTTLRITTVMFLALLTIAATRPGDPSLALTHTLQPEVTPAAPVEAAIVEMPAAAVPGPYHPAPVSLGNSAGYTPPDFQQYLDVRAKKTAFYDYLLPMVHEANQEVMRERVWLISLAETMVSGEQLSQADLEALGKIEKRYGIRTPAESTVDRLGDLIPRVDVVPASLVIAQAAKESGWGTSRFAQEGNNFFGIWCFFEGCGLLPRSRESGRNHEVAMFDSVEQGVRYYIRTINTHRAYDELREMRAEARRNNELAEGTTLANGLVRYSERGMDYVREIQSMIRFNELHRFTRSYSA